MIVSFLYHTLLPIPEMSLIKCITLFIFQIDSASPASVFFLILGSVYLTSLFVVLFAEGQHNEITRKKALKEIGMVDKQNLMCQKPGKELANFMLLFYNVSDFVGNHSFVQQSIHVKKIFLPPHQVQMTSLRSS